MSTKPISKLTRPEAEAALARERAWQAKGLSYSTRRIGALVARLAALDAQLVAAVAAWGRS